MARYAAPTRREFIEGGLVLTGVGLLGGCGLLPFPGGQPTRIRRIGYISFGRSGPGAFEAAFLQGLIEQGYTEGQNLTIDWRFTLRADEVAGLVTELVNLQVELIVAAGGSVISAKEVTDTVPIIMPVSGDPVGQDLVASLSRPGGNITGLTTLSSSTIARKRLELLREIAPRAVRVAVLWNAGNNGKAIEFHEMDAAAPTLGFSLDSLEVRSGGDFDAAFSAAAARPDALAALQEGLINGHVTRITGFALEHRLPSVFEAREHVEMGGLLSYGPNVPQMFRRAAAYVEKVLNSAKPADLPIEQPTTFDFAVNLKTADVLGLTIPQALLAESTEIIQ
jgi:putative ABC transport system substrate-binding protein